MIKYISFNGIKDTIIFLIIDSLQYLCWKGQSFFYSGGPIDSQGRMFYICILALYFLIPLSFICYIVYVRFYFKFIINIFISTILNIHVFYILFVYIYDTIIKRNFIN